MPCTVVKSAPILMMSPGNSCGVNVVQHPPAPARCAELMPPSAGVVSGMFLLMPLAMVTPSRTTDTTALFAIPASRTSDVLAVTVIDFVTPATAADAGCAHAAQPAAATTTGARCRKRERGMA